MKKPYILAFLTLTACGPSATTVEEQNQVITISTEIADASRVNRILLEELPQQQESLDTLLYMAEHTQNRYAKSILIKNIAELQAIIDKKRNDITANAVFIDQKRLAIKQLTLQDQPVELSGDDTSLVVGLDTIRKFTVVDSTQ